MKSYHPVVFVVLGVLLSQPAWAGPQHAGSTPQATPQGLNGIPLMMPNPVSPQFNDPGPQFTPTQPGNPVQQLSPLGNAGQPDSLGIR